MTFFISWQNWEQLTFILAVAIVFVFGAGFYKLWWQNRFIRKAEQEDEEKRARIQILRQTNNYIEEDSVPFGVRAIESGIEVDGIWISRSTTPARISSLKIPKVAYHSSESGSSTSTINDRHTSVASDISHISTLSQQPSYAPDQHNGAAGHSLLEKPSLGKTFDVAVPRDSPAPAGEGLSPNLYATYKPRQSSALRYSSYQETTYDAETLRSLEGVEPSKARRLVKTRKPKGMPTMETYTAESPRSGNSPHGSGSAATSVKSGNSPTFGDSDGSPYFSTAEEFQSAMKGKGRESDYFTVPRQSPTLPPVNPFEGPDVVVSSVANSLASSPNLIATPVTGAAAGDSNPDLRWPLMNDMSNTSSSTATPTGPSRNPSYGPGNIHRNTASRQINAGFQVLPAGHFEREANEICNDDLDWPTKEKRHSRRLQKKQRMSSLSKA